jgi:hypothetical protein
MLPDSLFAWLSGAIAGTLMCGAMLPDVINLSLIPTGAGLGGLLFGAYGACRRYPPERLGRVVMLGNLLGVLATALVLVLALVIDVLS